MTTLDKCRRLLKYFREGKIKTLAVHEVHPNLNKGDRLNYLYFTLPPCLNFQRNSPAMWQSALATYNDRQTRYLFFPEKVVVQSREQIMSDLVKHKLALLKNKHTDIWIKISQTLHENFNDDPRELIISANSDVIKILNTIRFDKKRFPHLNGPKMANYWLYILAQYTDIKLKNMSKISIIPDTHVLQASIQLGVIDKEIPSEKVSAAWEKLLSGSEITPVEMHPVLWNWSRNGFMPSVPGL